MYVLNVFPLSKFHHFRFIVGLVQHWDTCTTQMSHTFHTWIGVSGAPVDIGTAACGRGTGPICHGEPSVFPGGPWAPCPNAVAAGGSASSSPPGPWRCNEGAPSPAGVDPCGPWWSST